MDRTILFRIDLLAAVGELGDGSGVEIQERMQKPPYEREQLSINRVYPNLTDLAEDGLIEKDGEPGKAKSYTLTDAGREVLETRLEIMERALQE